jgi:hypothetical protein
VRLEGLGQLKKKSNGLIGIRSRDLPACSIVPQATTLLRSLCNYHVLNIYTYLFTVHLTIQWVALTINRRIVR